MNATLPMFSAENEQCVIGALLLNNDSIDFIGGLKPEHFFIEDHRVLFTAIRTMITAGRGCDVITLAEELLDRNDGDKWLPILGDMVANTPGTSNIGRYAQIVIDRATERALLVAASDINDLASGMLPTSEKLDKAQGVVMALADSAPHKEGRSIGSIIIDVVQDIQNGYEGNVVRNLTGYTDLDKRVDLLTPGDLIILAARPAMGKTSLAMNIAESVAEEKAVVVFSQEMGGNQLGTKMISSIGRIELERLLRKQSELTTEDLDRMAVAVDKISKLNLHIDDQPARSLHQVRSYARKVARNNGNLGLIVVDYLQLMCGDDKETRHEEVAGISRGLKAIAKELNVPVWALSQLNRGLESRPNKRPTMADLRESGQIEQDADVIAFIYRDEVYNPDTIDKGVAEIIFSKVRMGQVGTVSMAFNGHHARFDNLCREWSEQRPKEQAKRRGFSL